MKKIKEKILTALEPPYTCVDCGGKTGETHNGGCDIERCPKCKGQLLSCDCNFIPLNTEDKILVDDDEIEYKRFLVLNSVDEDFEVGE